MGKWKRHLRWKHLGGLYQNLRTTQTIVSIDEYISSVKEDGVRYLRWSFGPSLDQNEMRYGYVTKFHRDSKSKDPNQESSIEWQYDGQPCTGGFNPATGAAVLNFLLKTATVVITYRIMDADTVAVCIMEMDENHTPTVQMGNMCRIRPEEYINLKDTTPVNKRDGRSEEKFSAKSPRDP